MSYDFVGRNRQVACIYSDCPIEEGCSETFCGQSTEMPCCRWREFLGRKSEKARQKNFVSAYDRSSEFPLNSVQADTEK